MWECYTLICTWVGSVNSTHNIFSLNCFAPTRSDIWHGNMGGVVQSEVVFPMAHFLLRSHYIQMIFWRGLGNRDHKKCPTSWASSFCGFYFSLTVQSLGLLTNRCVLMFFFISMGRSGCEHGRQGGGIFKRPGQDPLFVHSEGTSNDDSLVYGEKQAYSHFTITFVLQLPTQKIWK